jgi:hypothetical protein
MNLINHLISEISASNANLSPREVTNILTDVIENEIIPDAFTHIRIQKLPSPYDVKIEELRSMRYGEKQVGALQEKVRFIQDLEKIRLNYDGSDLTNEYYPLDTSDNTQVMFSHKLQDVEQPKTRLHKDETDILSERLNDTSSVQRLERKIERPRENIIFTSRINNKIVQDPHIEYTIAEIESTITRNFIHKGLDVTFNFNIRSDSEEPTREKIIININLPDHEIDDKIEFWERIDKDIRNIIKKMDISESEKKVINRNLLTHIELV